MIKELITISTLILFLSFTACSSGSGDTAVISIDPSGEWRVDFITLVDECELLPADSNGFFDSETITYDGVTVTLSSLELPLEMYSGDFREPDSFTANAELTGDLFGQGFNCTLEENIAYNSLTEESAETVYEVKIICDDGSRCDTLARGTARRS